LIEIAHRDRLGEDQLQPPGTQDRARAADGFGGGGERVLVAARLHLEELAVGAALFLEIAVERDLPVLENEHLVATLLDVAQQVRRRHDLSLARIANLLDERIIRKRAGGSSPFVGSSRKRIFGAWTMACASLAICFMPSENPSSVR
jgi:hypothetical protein